MDQWSLTYSLVDVVFVEVGVVDVVDDGINGVVVEEVDEFVKIKTPYSKMISIRVVSMTRSPKTGFTFKKFTHFVDCD